jgi:hypothetical protein
MNKHTPGPWVVAEEAKIKHPEGTFIAQAQYWPDAYLIAAAPDLLAALKAARRFVVSSHDPVGSELDDIDAAIAKAEGKA